MKSRPTLSCKVQTFEWAKMPWHTNKTTVQTVNEYTYIYHTLYLRNVYYNDTFFAVVLSRIISDWTKTTSSIRVYAQNISDSILDSISDSRPSNPKYFSGSNAKMAKNAIESKIHFWLIIITIYQVMMKIVSRKSMCYASYLYR